MILVSVSLVVCLLPCRAAPQLVTNSLLERELNHCSELHLDSPSIARLILFKFTGNTFLITDKTAINTDVKKADITSTGSSG